MVLFFLYLNQVENKIYFDLPGLPSLNEVIGAQLYRFQCDTNFPNISGKLHYWTKEESITRNNNWTGYILWVDRYFFFQDVHLFSMKSAGTRAVLIDSTNLDPGQLSSLTGYEAKQGNWDVIAFQISDQIFPDIGLIPSLLLNDTDIIVTITNEDNDNPFEDFMFSYYPWIFQGIVIIFSFIILFMAVHKIIILLINKSEKLPLCPFFLMLKSCFQLKLLHNYLGFVTMLLIQ